ncbi:MAG: RnfABCDGE type electron transport complex subunit G [Candidatus Omnitrophica bacterium]|nr:RnfABCDGE type electron transport complex subunit G [Candidatus Omnitrophota bacterium]
MREILKSGFTLLIICLISSGLVSFVYGLTKERISKQIKSQEEKVLKMILVDAARVEEKTAGNLTYYIGYDMNDRELGRAFIVKTRGYGGDITICAGLDKKGNITSVKILSHTETPGLGSKIADANFLDKFNNRKAQDLGAYDAITGATISSTAVINAVKARAEELLKE